MRRGMRAFRRTHNDGIVAKKSAGILMYRRAGDGIEVLLVHPGGPFWARKDAGVWSIPKGEYSDGEDPLTAAQRELAEETGCEVDGPFVSLGTIVQKSGKTVFAWGAEGQCDVSAIRSNMVTIEWPPRSGRRLEIPEVDRAEWFSLAVAREKLVAGQGPFVDRLEVALRLSVE
jgi:predicted NUDIX family NTP pyrophosphohydrolase